MNEIIYSIIIPHKNNIDLLKKCICSIPIRDDVEIIIVDDNSGIEESCFPDTDRMNLRYVFLSSEKSNFAGRARNEGLKVAKGRWILFADSDDFFSENLNALFDKFKNHFEYDIVYLNANIIDEKGKVKSYKINKYINNYIKNRFYSEEMLRYGIWTPWTRMVNMNIIKKYSLMFEETPTGNDIYFGLMSSYYSVNFTYENKVIYYYYRPDSGSITDQYYTDKTFYDRLNQAIRINKLYNQMGYMFKIPLFHICINQLRAAKDRKVCKQIIKEVFMKNKINFFTEIHSLILYFIDKYIISRDLTPNN